MWITDQNKILKKNDNGDESTTIFRRRVDCLFRATSPAIKNKSSLID